MFAANEIEQQQKPCMIWSIRNVCLSTYFVACTYVLSISICFTPFQCILFSLKTVMCFLFFFSETLFFFLAFPLSHTLFFSFIQWDDDDTMCFFSYFLLLYSECVQFDIICAHAHVYISIRIHASTFLCIISRAHTSQSMRARKKSGKKAVNRCAWVASHNNNNNNKQQKISTNFVFHAWVVNIFISI